MKLEMRYLNRVKYAHSDEEMKQLASQGFIPVSLAAEQPAAPTQASGGEKKTADPSKKERKDTGKNDR